MEGIVLLVCALAAHPPGSEMKQLWGFKRADIFHYALALAFHRWQLALCD